MPCSGFQFEGKTGSQKGSQKGFLEGGFQMLLRMSCWRVRPRAVSPRKGNNKVRIVSKYHSSRHHYKNNSETIYVMYFKSNRALVIVL